MHYFIGDIHGYIKPFTNLVLTLKKVLSSGDTLVFLGDYIDRGEFSYEVVDLLIHLSRSEKFHTVFLRGNHEWMLDRYLRGEDSHKMYIHNGGDSTKRSYIRNCGSFDLPEHHARFFNNLQLYYEGKDFIAVHAGLNPIIKNIADQDEFDMLWIREQFYRADYRWEKTIIFGHTPTLYLAKDQPIYRDTKRNIIGIDSGIIYGRTLCCLSWPDRKIIM